MLSYIIFIPESMRVMYGLDRENSLSEVDPNFV